MTPRTILLIHQAFPGQFGNLAQSLVQDGHHVYALAMSPQPSTSDVTIFKYAPVRTQKQDGIPYLLQELDAKIIRGESAYRAMHILKDKGVNPDVIYAHPGWGEILFVKQVWPTARLVVYAEWFYNLKGQEVDFDKEFSMLTQEEEMRLQLKNTVFLHALNDADAAIAPTNWQKNRYPEWAQEKIQVIHDGIDIASIKRTVPKTLKIPNQDIALKLGMPIVTYVARHLEPIRGFHTFMRSLPQVFAMRPDAHVIIMGQDAGISSGYGQKNAEGKTWRQALQEELGNKVNWNNVHFLGNVPRTTYLSMLRISSCHVYLTIPFILSWSFLEAAVMGLPIVTSATPPVQEFSDLQNLTFVSFTDYNDLAVKIINTLQQKREYIPNLLLEDTLNVVHTLPRIREVLQANYKVEIIQEDDDVKKINRDISPTSTKPKTKAPMLALRRKVKKMK